MKLVFLIKRINLFKFFFPIIREALAREIHVECWLNQDSTVLEGSRGYQFPEEKKIPSFFPYAQPSFRKHANQRQLEEMLLAADTIDFVVSLHMPEFLFPPELIKRFKFQWVVHMFGPVNFQQLYQCKNSTLETARKHIYFSHTEDWIVRGEGFIKKFYPHLTGLMDTKNDLIKCVGHAEFDSFSEIVPEQVKKKYRIPGDREVFLYLPFSYYRHNPEAEWMRAFCGIYLKKNFFYKVYDWYRIYRDREARQFLRDRISEKNVIEAVKRFCERNNLFLVVKPRLKWPVSEPVKKHADLIIWDTETDHPPVFKEMMAVASVSMSFFSHGIMTSVFAKTFHLGASLPESYFGDPEFKYWFNWEDPSIFKFSGVCDVWSLEDIIDKLPDISLDRFVMDMEKREKYLKRFIGYDDHDSSKRILDILETCVRQRVAF